MNLESIKHLPISTILILWDIKQRHVTPATIDLAQSLSDEDWQSSLTIQALGGGNKKFLKQLGDYLYGLAQSEYPEFFLEEGN
jgi:hypothetical protein